MTDELDFSGKTVLVVGQTIRVIPVAMQTGIHLPHPRIHQVRWCTFIDASSPTHTSQPSSAWSWHCARAAHSLRPP